MKGLEILSGDAVKWEWHDGIKLAIRELWDALRFVGLVTGPAFAGGLDLIPGPYNPGAGFGHAHGN